MMDLYSKSFTTADVGSDATGILVAASLLCQNVLDPLAEKFGKPQILTWWVPVTDVAINPYTKTMWEGYRQALDLPDTEFEAEKFAAVSCPFMSGSGIAVKWPTPADVFDYAKTEPSVFLDSMILLPDSTLIVVSRFGTCRGFNDQLRVTAEAK